MKISVKAAVADIFVREKVEYVFGHTGGHIKSMWEEVNRAKIEIIINNTEGNGVFMADGYARASGKVGVILATAGPGATNMVTGLSTAYLDSIPIVAVGATVPTSLFGRNPLQDGSGRGRSIEQRMVFQSVCKQAMLAPSPLSVPDMVRDAFRTAISGRPGPVYIEIPSDFWDTEIEYFFQNPDQYKNEKIADINESDIEFILHRLHEANQPFILIGEGALEKNSVDLMMSMIEKLRIPFGVSPLGKNIVDEYHPLYLGVARSLGKTQKIYEYMRSSDFILFLGDRMHEWELNWHDKTLICNAKLAQVDSDPSEIGRVFPVDYSAVGSVKSFLERVPDKSHKSSEAMYTKVKDLWSKFPRLDRLEDGKGINPLNVNNIVEELIPDDAIIICDAGYAKSMAVMKFRTHSNQKFITADKFGPMGYSVPAALGAYLAKGNTVVCFAGDGGFQMTLNELGTAMNKKLKVIFIIENNGGCISILDIMEGCHCGTIFDNPDYCKLAEAYNMKGYSVRTTEEFIDAFKQALEQNTSSIIDTHVDQSRMTWE